MHQSVSSFFDMTDNYLHKSYGVKIRSELVQELCGSLSGKRILDVGSGDGSLSVPFLESNVVDFVDVSINMLNLIKSRIGNHDDKANFYHMPFEEFTTTRKYDLIIGVGILAHVPSIPVVIKMMSDLLAPGGHIILQFSDSENIVTRLTFLVSSRSKRRYELNRISYKEMKSSVTEVGLMIEKEFRYSIVLPGMGRLPNYLLYKCTRLTLKNRILSRFGSDLVWLLTKETLQ